MKLKFDPNLEYQQKAISAVVNVFDGQTIEGSDLGFEIGSAKKGELDLMDLGVGNRLEISDEKILENIKKIQKRKSSNIKREDRAGKLQGRNFSVEMETGTGKTYVYLRTIHELHQKYGFKKFIIVVPSIAIREGVLKNLEITEEHFKDLYGNVPLNYFVYDSSRLGKLRSFATSNTLQIMVINIDAFRRDENIIKRAGDRMSGRRPIEFVQATNPIVIMDEPQNMETEKSKRAIESLKPLCTLRYSATHRNYYNLLYRLTPVDAYDLGLVKKIEVDSVLEENGLNEAYIEVLSITPQKTQIKANLKIEKSTKNGTKKETVTVKTQGTFDLHELSNERDVYEGFVVSAIDAQEGFVEFANGEKVYEGKIKGESTEEIQRMQMEETVREHLDKEKRLKNKDIKVLSLFFIDRVKNYRDYETNDYKGKFAKWFEEIYEKLTKEDKYKELEVMPAEEVHEGYFSKDNKGRLRDSKTGEAQYDVPTYDLIMKDKEKLLSFDTSIKFIFSHSALREGWDNPNVFQICTLNKSRSKLKKRQEIGRGLRIPVNQDGERVFDENINILTVVANESYEDFARQLQKEIEEEAGVEFGRERIKRKEDRRKLNLKKGWKADKEFLELWKRIQPRTRYQVQLDSSKLVVKIADRIKKLPSISKPKIRAEKVSLEMDKEQGIETRFKRSSSKEVKATCVTMPNLLEYLSQGTDLTKQTLLEILEKSDRLGDALVNPQHFLDLCLEETNKILRQMLVDGIKYEKIGDMYAMSLFESEELESYTNNMCEVKNQQKSLFDYVIYDSDTEKEFARELESMERVKFYIKLPGWFKIDTPLGTYNPDWAIVFNGDRRVYFVAESKKDTSEEELRLKETLKIKCGEKHFEQLDGVEFDTATKPKELLKR